MAERIIRSLAQTFVVATFVAIAVVLVAPRGRASQRPVPPDSGPWTKPVPKAACGANDRIETGLQGQTTLAERMTKSSERSYSCNLELVGQFRGEGASFQMAALDTCAYYGTANGTGQQQKGVVVIDASNPAKPFASTYLDARPMWDPWESLKVNVPRKLLAAVQADRGNGVEPGFAVYDVSVCARPVLKASVLLPAAVRGHAGNFAPDGLTYYGSQLGTSVYPIDVRDPSDPRLLHVWPGDPERGRMGVAHDVELDAAGTTLYSAQPSFGLATPPERLQALGGLGNGLVITDVTDFKAQKADPKPRIVGSLLWRDGAIAQSPQRFSVKGHPYILFTDEMGAGGIGGAKAACAQQLPPFGFARIIDIADPAKPTLVSQLKLEVHDPANCDAVAPDTSFSGTFGYSSHYCTVDNAAEARFAACSYFEAGVRVFDLQDPARPREIAYYKPPAVAGGPIPGSNHATRTGESRTTDWASSNVRWLRRGDTTELWFTSHDNGFQIVRFTNSLASIGKSMAGRDPVRDLP
jgi:hypothetical protein